MANILIGCKLPHGLQLQVTERPEVVVLNGQNQNAIDRDFYVPTTPFGETEIDNDFWQAWKKENAGLDMLKNGLIFEAPVGKPAELKAKAKDAPKSGLEPNNPKEIKKDGVEVDTQGK